MRALAPRRQIKASAQPKIGDRYWYGERIGTVVEQEEHRSLLCLKTLNHEFVACVWMDNAALVTQEARELRLIRG